jgi:hypothetical protein
MGVMITTSVGRKGSVSPRRQRFAAGKLSGIN